MLAAPAGVQQFDIAAGAAEAALKQFSAQSGCQVLTPTRLVQGIRTHAVKGTYTAEAALDRLLAHTGLVARIDHASGAFAIVRMPRPNPPAPKGPEARQ
jgi:hypothetical protein